jgi:predicted PurR-regulated permease PerM
VSDVIHDGSARRLPPWIWKGIFAFWGVYALLQVGETAFGKLRQLLLMLLVSLFLSLAIEPAVNWMARRGIRRGLATGAVLAIIIVLAAVFIFAIGSLVAKQASSLFDKAPDYVRSIEGWVNRTFNQNVDARDLIDRITESNGPFESLATNTLSLSATFAGFLFQALGVAMFTFYLVADGPRFRRAICGRFRPAVQERVLIAWEVAIDKTGGYIYSRALLAFFAAVAHWIFFAIAGVRSPAALAIFVGLVSQFLPVVGTYAAGILPIIVTLVDQPVKALWVIGFIVLYQQFENYVLLPRITARTMDLHPAVAFGSAIAGSALLGPVGAVLALPVAASLQAFLTMYGHRHQVVASPLTGVDQSSDMDAAVGNVDDTPSP